MIGGANAEAVTRVGIGATGVRRTSAGNACECRRMQAPRNWMAGVVRAGVAIVAVHRRRVVTRTTAHVAFITRGTGVAIVAGLAIRQGGVRAYARAAGVVGAVIGFVRANRAVRFVIGYAGSCPVAGVGVVAVGVGTTATRNSAGNRRPISGTGTVVTPLTFIKRIEGSICNA